MYDRSGRPWVALNPKNPDFRPATGAPMPCATRSLPTVWIALAQVLHHGEQFLALEPLHPGEMD